jgi:hypothetical protein
MNGADLATGSLRYRHQRMTGCLNTTACSVSCEPPQASCMAAASRSDSVTIAFLRVLE